MKIGELAKRARCPAVTIRYYEKIGLLSGDKRDHLNHRVYGSEDIARLRLILHCRNHGISIKDIKTLLELKTRPGGTGLEAIEIIRNQIDNLKKQRESLDQLIESLSRVLDATEMGNADGMEIIDTLESPCPYCPDYGEGGDHPSILRDGAVCLANPAIRKRHEIF